MLNVAQSKLAIFEQIYLKLGLPSILLLFVLGVVAGYINSPLATTTQVNLVQAEVIKLVSGYELAEQRMVSTVRVLRQVCRNTAQTQAQRDECEK